MRNIYDHNWSKLFQIVILFAICFTLPVAHADELSLSTDYDGDRLGDLIFFDSTESTYLVRSSKNGQFLKMEVGETGDIPVPGDYNGDSKADFATYNRTTSIWKIIPNGGKSAINLKLGNIGDLPVPGKYTGNSCTDFATYSKTTGKWTIWNCAIISAFSGNTPTNEQVTNAKTEYDLPTNAVPVSGDYDCDGKTDPGVFDRLKVRWTIRVSQEQILWIFNFGLHGDIPIPADFNGDGCTQAGIYRPWTNTYYTGISRNKARLTPVESVTQWGLSGDRPTIANVDGDAKADFMIYRPTSNQYYIQSGKNFQYTIDFGLPQIQDAFGVYGDKYQVVSDIINDYEAHGSGDPRKYIIAAIVLELCPAISTTEKATWLNNCLSSVDRVLANPSAYGLDPYLFYVYPLDKSFATTELNTIYTKVIGTGQATPLGKWTSTLPTTYNNSLPLPVNRGYLNYPNIKSDMNRNGRTDVVMLKISAFSGNSEWSFFHDDGKKSVVSFGDPRAHFIIADYNGDGQSEIASVSMYSEDKDNLYWATPETILTSVGTKFGVPGDRPLAGDFDGDGKADKAILKNVDGFFHWYIKLTTGGSLDNILFGLGSDEPFAADMDADGKDEMIVAQNAGGQIIWYYRKADSKNNTVTSTPWGLATDTLLQPMDFNGDGFTDFAVARNVGRDKVFFLRFAKTKNASMAIPFGLSSDIALVGNFSGFGQAEMAVYRQGSPATLFVRRPDAQIRQITLSDAGGMLIPSSGALIKGSNKSDTIGCDVTTDFSDGIRTGALWKPFSDSTGNAVFLLPASYWTATANLEIYGSDGTMIVKPKRRSCCPNGGRAHYDVPMSAVELAAFNPITVKLTMQNGTTECRVVPNATSRID